MAKLDKFYPTDHCAFCPLWTEIRRCKESPSIFTLTNSRLETLEKSNGGYRAVDYEIDAGDRPRTLHLLRPL